MQSIFDGHNDTLLRLWLNNDHAGKLFLDGDSAGHIGLARARAGGRERVRPALLQPVRVGELREQLCRAGWPKPPSVTAESDP